MRMFRLLGIIALGALLVCSAVPEAEAGHGLFGGRRGCGGARHGHHRRLFRRGHHGCFGYTTGYAHGYSTNGCCGTQQPVSYVPASNCCGTMSSPVYRSPNCGGSSYDQMPGNDGRAPMPAPPRDADSFEQAPPAPPTDPNAPDSASVQGRTNSQTAASAEAPPAPPQDANPQGNANATADAPSTAQNASGQSVQRDADTQSSANAQRNNVDSQSSTEASAKTNAGNAKANADVNRNTDASTEVTAAASGSTESSR